jgi:predicted nucleic acid-binding OB-fold protein
VKMYKYYKTLKDKSLTSMRSSKRKLFWSLWERHKDKYGSYKEFKESWDPHQSIREEIKKDLKVEKEKLRLFKRTVPWFLGRRKASRYGNNDFSNER